MYDGILSPLFKKQDLSIKKTMTEYIYYDRKVNVRLLKKKIFFLLKETVITHINSQAVITSVG